MVPSGLRQASQCAPGGQCRRTASFLPLSSTDSFSVLTLPVSMVATPCCTLLWTLTLCSVAHGEGQNSARPPVFRVGSGAGVTPTPSAHQSKNSQSPQPTLGQRLVHPVLILCLPASVFFVLMMMVPAGGPGGGGGRDFNYRIPPAWSPEQEHTYSFRAYMTDVSQWIMLTDLAPHQQAAALVMRLGGSAREMARIPNDFTPGAVPWRIIRAWWSPRGPSHLSTWFAPLALISP